MANIAASIAPTASIAPASTAPASIVPANIIVSTAASTQGKKRGRLLGSKNKPRAIVIVIAIAIAIAIIIATAIKALKKRWTINRLAMLEEDKDSSNKL